MQTTSKEYPFSVLENPLEFNDAKLEDIKKGDLYALLSICTNEDLDPLVKIITSRTSNHLEIDEKYKRYTPDHKKYFRSIANEIRASGGHLIGNVFRGGDGPPYDEIVIDACKACSIPFDSKDTVKNELDLLTIHLNRQLNTLVREDQETEMADARNEALKKISHTSIKHIAAVGLLPGIVSPALAAIRLNNDTMGPAYSATVPCVVHIAYLRKRFLDGLTDSSTHSDQKSGSVRSSSLVPATTDLQRLDICDTENDPLLSLACILEPTSQRWQPVDDNSDGISRLNPLLQSIPSLAVAEDVASTKYMEVIINGPLLKAKGKEGYRLITMIDKKPCHGTLLDPSNLSTIVNATALLQVASVALAQKHLADISEKLSEIKACIEKIFDHQQEERRSIMTGSTRYFEQVAHSVLTGELSSSVRIEIERQEVDLLRVQDHLLVDIRKKSKEVADIKNQDAFGSEGMLQEIQSHLKCLDDLYQQLVLCIRARACGWQLLVAFPGEEKLKEVRRRGIQESLGLLNEDSELIKTTDQITRKKIKDMAAFFNKDITLNERKLLLLRSTDEMLISVALGKEKIERDLHAIDAFILEQQQPVKLFVKVRGEKIVEVCAE